MCVWWYHKSPINLSLSRNTESRLVSGCLCLSVHALSGVVCYCFFMQCSPCHLLKHKCFVTMHRFVVPLLSITWKRLARAVSCNTNNTHKTHSIYKPLRTVTPPVDNQDHGRCSCHRMSMSPYSHTNVPLGSTNDMKCMNNFLLENKTPFKRLLNRNLFL